MNQDRDDDDDDGEIGEPRLAQPSNAGVRKALPAELDTVDDDGKPELVDHDLAAEHVGIEPAF